jgi:hypothetical protein
MKENKLYPAAGSAFSVRLVSGLSYICKYKFSSHDCSFFPGAL